MKNQKVKKETALDSSTESEQVDWSIPNAF